MTIKQTKLRGICFFPFNRVLQRRFRAKAVLILVPCYFITDKLVGFVGFVSFFLLFLVRKLH